MDIPVNMPVGANNRLGPSSAGSPPPTVFQPGVHHNVFLAPFLLPRLTWYLTERTAVADASSPGCTLEQYTATTSGKSSTVRGDNPSPPSPAAAARLVPDTYGPGYSVGALPPGNALSVVGAVSNGASTASNGLGVVQQALGGMAATATPFTVNIIWMAIGSDAACWGGDPYVRIYVNGQNISGELALPTDCGFISACAGAYGYTDKAASTNIVKPTDATASVRIQLTDRDSTFCGGGDDLEIDTGDFTVNNLVGQPNGLQNCADNDGWRVCWTVTGNGRPRACMNWNAQFIDGANAGPGFTLTEDYLASSGVQSVPASNAVAQVSVRNGPVTQTYTGTLDGDGCVPIDNSPETGQYAYDPAVGANGLTITYKWSSELCVDPSSNGCLNAAGQRTSGARILVRAVGSTTDPFQLCSILTQDENLTDPTGACQVVHASEGAFAAWQNGIPPAKVDAVNGRQTAETRVAAVMSNLVRRESQTSGDIGLVSALITRRLAGDGSNVGRLAPSTYALNAGEPDTFYDPDSSVDSVILRPDLCCDAGTFTNCRRWFESTPCASNQQFLYGGDHWKYVIAHEFGHLIQDRMTGPLSLIYASGGGLTGAPAKCRCDHVSSSNQLHCLQSISLNDAAQTEGFAQYYATRAFNRDDRSDGVFRYYKEFLDDSCVPGADPAGCLPFQGLVSSKPPIPVNPRQARKWRNNYCTVGTLAPEAVTNMGTELDWMGFYLAWNTLGSNKSSLNDIADVYIQACGGTPCSINNSVSFEGTSSTSSLRQAALVVIGKSNQLDPNYLNFATQGRAFGVSGETAQ